MVFHYWWESTSLPAEAKIPPKDAIFQRMSEEETQFPLTPSMVISHRVLGEKGEGLGKGNYLYFLKIRNCI